MQLDLYLRTYTTKKEQKVDLWKNRVANFNHTHTSCEAK